MTETVEQIAERLHDECCAPCPHSPLSPGWMMWAEAIASGECTFEFAAERIGRRDYRTRNSDG
jgi:hypothetical protein